MVVACGPEIDPNRQSFTTISVGMVCFGFVVRDHSPPRVFFFPSYCAFKKDHHPKGRCLVFCFDHFILDGFRKNLDLFQDMENMSSIKVFAFILILQRVPRFSQKILKQVLDTSNRMEGVEPTQRNGPWGMKPRIARARRHPAPTRSIAT